MIVFKPGKRCDFCDKKFLNAKQYVSHVASSHNVFLNTCEKCDPNHIFYNIKAHKVTVHGESGAGPSQQPTPDPSDDFKSGRVTRAKVKMKLDHQSEEGGERGTAVSGDSNVDSFKKPLPRKSKTSNKVDSLSDNQFLSGSSTARKVSSSISSSSSNSSSSSSVDTPPSVPEDSNLQSQSHSKSLQSQNSSNVVSSTSVIPASSPIANSNPSATVTFGSHHEQLNLESNNEEEMPFLLQIDEDFLRDAEPVLAVDIESEDEFQLHSNSVINAASTTIPPCNTSSSSGSKRKRKLPSESENEKDSHAHQPDPNGPPRKVQRLVQEPEHCQVDPPDLTSPLQYTAVAGSSRLANVKSPSGTSQRKEVISKPSKKRMEVKKSSGKNRIHHDKTHRNHNSVTMRNRRKSNKTKRVASIKCNRCDKSFKTKKIFRNHQVLVHKKKLPFECPKKCGRTFQKEHNLKQHVLTCVGKLMCSECKQVFTRRSNLNRHIKKICPVIKYANMIKTINS